MTGLFSEQTKAENRERASYIKRRVEIADAIAALGLDTDMGDECPRCHALGAMASSKTGESAHCSSCDETFDVVALVRAARGMSFAAACDFLETECLKARDDKTRDLFHGR